jgi:hypothetical protein
MKSTTIAGIILIVLGIAGLALGRIEYTSKETVLDIGPIEATAETKESIPIPDIASIAALLAGVALVVLGAKRRA